MSESIGEQSPSAMIDRAIQGNRLAHALLVYGQNLKQVERFAYDLAAKLLNLENGEHRLWSHPDVFTVRPSKKSRVISIEDTRELIRKIQHTPQQGDRKVAFLHEVDRLNKYAANAFLKTLEEPPLNTTILLLTTRPHALLATIRSRCQLFRLPTSPLPLEDERALDWLQSYQSWLSGILDKQPAGKSAVPHHIMGLYGLVERFRQIIDALTKEAWKSESNHLPEDMEDEERIALESRISVALRDEFLSAIEQTTERFARQALEASPEAASKLVRSTVALEKLNALFTLQLRADVALEAYLLKALRIWSA